MIASPRSEPKIERYLARLRVALRGLPDREIDDILRELRSHVDDLAGKEGSGVEAALQSLGDPLDLAQTYRSENQMLRAECSGSPLTILQGLRHASRGTLGRVTATALYVLGYFGMGTLWAGALEKLLAPSRGGLWYIPGDLWSITLIVGGNPPAGARELLGWWLVPITLLGGWGVKYASDRVAQWWIARYRRSKASPEV
jgi:HAAS domain-containing protein